jgi:hypothetical protein
LQRNRGLTGVRVAVVIAVVGIRAVAGADPKPDPWDSSHVLKLEPGVIVVPDLPKPSPGAPAYGGGWATGQIITPPDHPDARDYPKGMVIRPPRTGDERAWPNGIWLVPDWGKPGEFLRGLGDGLQDGLGALGQLLAPEHH